MNAFILAVLNVCLIHSPARASTFSVEGQRGAFRLRASFFDAAVPGVKNAPDIQTASFAFDYDPRRLGLNLEDRYLRSIFGGAPRTLTERDVNIRGTHHVVAADAGTTGDYIVIEPNDYRVLRGYAAIGVQMFDGEGSPNHAHVVLFQGDLSRPQRWMHALLVGSKRYYRRPLLTCQISLLGFQRARQVAANRVQIQVDAEGPLGPQHVSPSRYLNARD